MSDRQIIEAVQRLAGTQLSDEVYIIPATVTAVNLDSNTIDCEPIGGNAITDMPSVQLTAEVDDGFLLIPAIGSTVLVLFSKRQPPYVTMFSELQGVQVTIGDKAIEMSGEKTIFNSGSFGGLIKINDLVAKLNNVENLLNSLIVKYNAHVHTANNTPTLSIETGSITPTTVIEIENPTVVHG